MDFFEAQARAHKRTSRLVVLFALAVIATVLATYVAAVFVVRHADDTQVKWRDAYGFSGVRPVFRDWWNPRLFVGVTSGTLAVVGLASLLKWRQYAAGGHVVAEAIGGRLIDSNTTDANERRLLNVVEEMAIAAGVPVPPVYVMDDEPTINAFAAGLTTGDAVVAVTRGTLQKLSRDELQGVMAHEFSHILNGDMRLNMRLTALVFGILVIGLLGRGILWTMGRLRGRTRGKGGGIPALFTIALALLVIGYIGYFFGRLLQAAVSRQREFLADAAAVQFTRNPGGITGALKKIGGYALGSALVSTKSTEIGHFFFAQGFRSGWTGWWSTHPPLAQRIRAIDPQFDGQMYVPAKVVDVATESFRVAGFGQGQGQRLTMDETVRQVFDARADVPMSRPPPSRIAFEPGAAIASTGTLTAGKIAHAQRLLDDVPERLRDATRSKDEAPAVVFALLFDDDPTVRGRQLNIVVSRSAPGALRTLDALEPVVRALGAEQRLPVLQLTLPALRQIPPGELASFLDVLDELVHADDKVSPFEFALQKLLVRTLELGHSPGSGTAQYHSMVFVADEISIVLSALARAASRDMNFAPQAFRAGAAQLRLVEDRLRFHADCDFVLLDRALDKLARASLPIKQAALTGAAHVVNADGRVEIAEVELLRAVSAALDCPMPPIGIGA